MGPMDTSIHELVDPKESLCRVSPRTALRWRGDSRRVAAAKSVPLREEELVVLDTEKSVDSAVDDIELQLWKFP